MRRLAGTLVAAGLVLGLIGGGVGAAFVWNGSATQAINIGTLGAQLSSTTPNAVVTTNSVTCPAITVNNSAGFYYGAPYVLPTCNFKITSTGTIPLLNASIWMVVTSNGAELGKFNVVASGAISATKFLDAAVPAGAPGVPLGVAIAFPADVTMTFDYGEDLGLALDNASLGKTIGVQFLITVAQ